MESKTLIIDCQIFQTPAWDRGMGKYSMDLISAISQHEKLQHANTVLLFSKHLEANKQAIEQIVSLIGSAEIVHLDLRPSKNKAIGGEALRNSKVLDDFLSTNGYDADFLMLSSFQKPLCPAFPKYAKKLLLCYDIIPLLYPHKYQPDDNYLSRLRVLFEADRIFTISQTVRDDLNTLLGIPLAKMVNIDGAPIDRGQLVPAKPKITLPDKYILMPTGDDIRKNKVIGVKGFEEFIKQNPEY
jgi:hypothetical protein